MVNIEIFLSLPSRKDGFVEAGQNRGGERLGLIAPVCDIVQACIGTPTWVSDVIPGVEINHQASTLCIEAHKANLIDHRAISRREIDLVVSL